MLILVMYRRYSTPNLYRRPHDKKFFHSPIHVPTLFFSFIHVSRTYTFPYPLYTPPTLINVDTHSPTYLFCCTHTYARPITHIHTRTYAHTFKDIHIHIHTFKYVLPYTLTMPTNICTDAHTCICPQTCTL